MDGAALGNKTWRHADDIGDYLISTSSSLLNHDFINNALASEDAYWAKPLTPDQLRLMLAQSLTFGVYEALPSARNAKSADSPSSPRTPSPTLEAEADEHLEQIGLARFVTDYVTFVYISDVYILPDFRGRGLGKRLMRCFEDVLKEMPNLRRALLLTSSEKNESFYERELAMWDVQKEGDLKTMTRKAYVA